MALHHTEQQVCKQKKDGHHFQYPKASQLCALTQLAFEVPGRLYSVFVTFSESHSLIRMGRISMVAIDKIKGLQWNLR